VDRGERRIPAAEPLEARRSLEAERPAVGRGERRIPAAEPLGAVQSLEAERQTLADPEEAQGAGRTDSEARQEAVPSRARRPDRAVDHKRVVGRLGAERPADHLGEGPIRADPLAVAHLRGPGTLRVALQPRKRAAERRKKHRTCWWADWKCRSAGTRSSRRPPKPRETATKTRRFRGGTQHSRSVRGGEASRAARVGELALGRAGLRRPSRRGCAPPCPAGSAGSRDALGGRRRARPPRSARFEANAA